MKELMMKMLLLNNMNYMLNRTELFVCQPYRTFMLCNFYTFICIIIPILVVFARGAIAPQLCRMGGSAPPT